MSEFTALQDAILDQLIARYRTGDRLWAVTRNPASTKALEALRELGWVEFDSGPVQGAWRANLTEAAVTRWITNSPYTPPVLQQIADLQAEVEQLQGRLERTRQSRDVYKRALFDVQNGTHGAEYPDWTQDDNGVTNASDRFRGLVTAVAELLDNDRFMLMEGREGRKKAAGLIVAQLAHKHGVKA